MGDLVNAERLLTEALKLRKALTEDDLGVAESLNNLGVIAISRGNLSVAWNLHRASLEIRHRVAPESLDEADSLMNIGTLENRRGNYHRAISLLEKALSIHKAKNAPPLKTASLMNNLGIVFSRIDAGEAREYYRQALEAVNTVSPEAPLMATIIHNLGHTFLDEDLPKAAQFLQKALQVEEKLAPQSADVADTLHNLGIVEFKMGYASRAIETLHRAFEIRKRLLPNSNHSAETLAALADVYRESGQASLPVVKDYYVEALELVESSFRLMGGASDVMGRFLARYADYYRGALEVQLELNRPAEAFKTLQRSRARNFLDLLAERDTVFNSDIPEGLDAERRSLAVRFDRTQQKLAEFNLRDHAQEIEAIQEKLRDLRDEARDIEERIRRASPKLAALQYPEPLDLDATRTILDPGTLLLSFSVGKESIILFSLTKDGELRVDQKAISEDDLRRRVETLRQQIDDIRDTQSPLMAGLQNSAKQLYDDLLAPVADRIEQSERLLILADGPLHYLPWVGLLHETADGRSQYLAESKPIHLALSATVFAELKKLRRQAAAKPPIQIAAFGDPVQLGSQEAAVQHRDPVVRFVAEDNPFAWQPLPHSRLEVERIAELYPPDERLIYLGSEATETHAKAIGKDVSILHFSTHGQINERLPMSSFLALTIPKEPVEGQDNGLLQVWEIFERVRIDADLVVLSACQTALGEEIRGEGLNGLTRAFQYAGARTVAASLWQVEDQATAELMSRFYRHLRQGKSKDQALVAAQQELIRSDDSRLQTPYAWAAFQLYGDWQ